MRWSKREYTDEEVSLSRRDYSFFITNHTPSKVCRNGTRSTVLMAMPRDPSFDGHIVSQHLYRALDCTVDAIAWIGKACKS